MAFKLGNYAVKEVIYGVAQDFNGNLLYTLDQLTNAQIEVSSDPTEITDKRGNIIRQVYNNKTATFTATSALASPVLLNANSGSAIEYASATTKINMPKIVTVAPGTTLDVPDAKSGTMQVMGIYNNGANGAVLTSITTGAPTYDDATGTYTYLEDTTAKTIKVPSGTDTPTLYLVKYDRDVESGMKMSNLADKFPETIRLTLYVAVMDPCSDSYKAGYLYIPSFTPDPSVTISFDSENQEVDFNGNVNLDFCGTEKLLYTIYFPDENAVLSGSAE